ncbi:hypothetical protein CDAR_292311 [Caerostris darwini]|uniref:LAGLIDADG homing endonuclease n=1 Tax=Caerostris darwini TaxID=1538125 RepID=A0AAV4UCW2_9ARAC|nr:hypothetical protein CDAR_292311 [Caerostris darwini]
MTVTASSGIGARFIFDTKNDIVLFLIPCLLGEQSNKRRRIIWDSLSGTLIGRQGLGTWGRMGLECVATKWIALNECLALFITNPKDEPHRELLLKHFRQHKGFNAFTIDELCNDGVMKIYPLLKRWWLFHELTQPDSRMPLVVCINDCHCFFWHRGSISLRHET